MKNMVNYIKDVTDHVNAIIFVFNGQVKRFDQSQKMILKVFMASIGHESMNNVGVVFTNLPHDEKNAVSAKEKAAMVSEEFSNMNIKGVPSELPYWFVDNSPEDTNMSMKGVLAQEVWNSTIRDLEQKRDAILHYLLDWAKK